jgi:metal-responsive CopG/Arc/MetJ family transcriptional regulator
MRTKRKCFSKTFTVMVDAEMTRTLDDLSEKLGKSRAGVFRKAVTILKFVEEGREQGLKFVLCDCQGQVKKEIVFS